MTENIKNLNIHDLIQRLDQQENNKKNQIKLLTLHVVKDCPREIKQNIYTRTLKSKEEQWSQKVLLDLDKIAYIFKSQQKDLTRQYEY